MTENIKKINNPLTIIAIFAALAEINATVSLGLIPENLQAIFIWFILAFPTLLVICFFLTLNFNPRVMYAPSDYKDEKNFLDTISGRFKEMQFNVTKDNIIEIEQKLQAESIDILDRYESSDISIKMLNYGNSFFSELISLFKNKLEEHVFDSFGFGIQSEDLFLLSIVLNKHRFPKNFATDHNYILRFTEKQGKVIGEIAGKNIKSDSYKTLSKQTFELIEKMISQSIVKKTAL
ncbi:MAG: hypothetical protein PHI48_05685 [Bacteroidales bacterium]|nr:hypothetical protein [Bacteroidales bacterium]